MQQKKTIVVHGNELYHFGIKGQKWGLRRYQNPDGSLTPEGREHYGYGEVKEKYKNDLEKYSSELEKDTKYMTDKWNQSSEVFKKEFNSVIKTQKFKDYMYNHIRQDYGNNLETDEDLFDLSLSDAYWDSMRDSKLCPKTSKLLGEITKYGEEKYWPSVKNFSNELIKKMDEKDLNVSNEETKFYANIGEQLVLDSFKSARWTKYMLNNLDYTYDTEDIPEYYNVGITMEGFNNYQKKHNK